MYGGIKTIDFPNDRMHPNFARSFAYVEYEKPEEAEKAIKYMDGGRFSWLTILLFLFCILKMKKVHVFK